MSLEHFRWRLLVLVMSCGSCLRLHTNGRKSIARRGYHNSSSSAVLHGYDLHAVQPDILSHNESPTNEDRDVEYLVTDITVDVWKHSDSIDVRKMLLPQADGNAAALKITKVPSCADDGCTIPEPSDFAGDRTIHEIAMFQYLNTRVPAAQEYLVPFLGGGDVRLTFEDGKVVGLELWSSGSILYKSKCSDGKSSRYGYTEAHCRQFQKWIKDGYKMIWLLTAYQPRSLTILEYLQRLLNVKRVEGFSEDQLRERRMKEIANAISACQAMLRKLYSQAGFVHADYHLKNMLVALPHDSILAGAARADQEPSIPAALLFDLDYSGFVDANARHVQSTLIPGGASVLNIPMLHALPVLDLSNEASDNLRALLDRHGLISWRTVKENADVATGELLHKSDLWLGMMQLHEFSTGCDETPLAVQLAGLPKRSKKIGQREAALAQDHVFSMLVEPNWPARGKKDSVLEKLYLLDQEFESHKAELGEEPHRHWEGFQGAWFRVKMLVKAFVVEQWRLGA